MIKILDGFPFMRMLQPEDQSHYLFSYE